MKLIKSLLIAPLLAGFFIAPAYAQKTKAQLTTEVGTTYPDNTAGAITPLGVRTYETDVLNSIMPTAPVVSGNTACFDGTTGLLKDCGIAPSTLVIGTTSISSGSTSNILFDNNGKLGEYVISGSGNVVMSSGPTISSPTITTPAVTGGTLTSPALSGGTIDGATITTATIPSPAISSPNLTGTPTGSAASTTVNGVTCTLGTTCTISASAGTITPGTTTVASGTNNGLLYDNAGVLGNLATANSGVLVTSGAGVPSISTTLPSGLSIGSPTLTGTVGGTGVIPSSVLANTAVSAGSYGSSTSIPSFTVNGAGQLTAAAGNAVVAPSGTLTGTTLASNVVTSSLTTVGTIGTGVWAGTPVGLSGGGTNNGSLAASNGGIVWSDASKLNVLPGTVTAGQCLLSGSSATPAWGSCAGGASVLSIAGNTGAFTLAGGVTNSTNQIQADGNYSGWALHNCTLSASVAASVLTVALKDNAGSNPSATSPCYINYRNVTAATGSTTLVAQTGALSVDTNAIGATLGAPSSSTPFRFWVVAFNNGGTNVLALINCSGLGQIFPLDDFGIASSTPFSASATSPGVFYTENGTTITSKAYRILGYIEYGTGLATAGTYASGPTIIQAFGPGVHKPGESVQRIYTSTSSGIADSSGVYVASNLNRNFTKLSAADSVRLDATGTAIGTSGVSTTLGLRFFRGNISCTTAIGPENKMSGLTTGFFSSTSINWIDPPASSGTTSAQYTVCFQTLGATFPYVSSTASFILEEIMG